jgi:two-component system KDP operon response regulator KdpE
VIEAGDLRIDMEHRLITKAGKAVKLSPKEYALLCELAVKVDRPVPHADLLRSVWRNERADIQYLRVYVGQLRQKLGTDILQAVPGVGYMLRR